MFYILKIPIMEVHWSNGISNQGINFGEPVVLITYNPSHLLVSKSWTRCKSYLNSYRLSLAHKSLLNTHSNALPLTLID